MILDISKLASNDKIRGKEQELKKLGIEGVKCVYSKEKPFELKEKTFKGETLKLTPGSNSFVPPVMGLIMAGEIIKDLIDLT